MNVEMLLALRDPAGVPSHPLVLLLLGVLTFALHIAAMQVMLGAGTLVLAGAKGQGGTGDGKASPALAGQNPQYFVRTMQQFHGEVRTNDAKRGMRAFAGRLSTAEVEALATYYADLPASR